MTRIAFTADLHIDAYPGKIDAATSMNARLLDYLRTTRWVAEHARDLEAEALVVAGDFTEKYHVEDWLLRHIQDALSDGPARQLLLKGNHDRELRGESKVSVLAEMGREWSGHSTPGLVEVGDVIVALIPYLSSHWLRAQPGFAAAPAAEVNRVLAEQWLVIAQGLYAQAKRAHPHLPTVLVCHQTLAGAAMSDRQVAFLGDQTLVVDSRALAAVGFEAVVAGHLHRHQVVVPGERPVLYAGSIERVDWGEAREEKGFLVADVGPGRFDWEFVPTPARHYLDLPADGSFNPAAAEDAIVRGIGLEPDVDLDDLRRELERAGAFEVARLTHRAIERSATVARISEDLTPTAALEAFVPDDEPDRAAVLDLGRQILAEVTA